MVIDILQFNISHHLGPLTPNKIPHPNFAPEAPKYSFLCVSVSRFKTNTQIKTSNTPEQTSSGRASAVHFLRLGTNNCKLSGWSFCGWLTCSDHFSRRCCNWFFHVSRRVMFVSLLIMLSCWVRPQNHDFREVLFGAPRVRCRHGSHLGFCDNNEKNLQQGLVSSKNWLEIQEIETLLLCGCDE